MAQNGKHKGRIMLATPSLSGDVWMNYVNSYIHSLVGAANAGWEVQTNFMMGNSCIPYARSIIAQDFWDSECDQLFCIDADMDWDPKAFVRMINAEDEFLTGMYPRRSQGQKKFTTRGLFEENGKFYTKGCGFGFVCLKRSVFAKMREAYPELRARDKMRRRWMFMFFDTMIDDFEPLGEDFSFCKRWDQIGGRIRIDPDIDFSHVGPAVYAGNFSRDRSNEILDWNCLKPEGEEADGNRDHCGDSER